jgi:hypothetical protein
MDAPFGGNLLPHGATGGQIEFSPGGSQHVSIYTHGAHVSYDRCGSSISGVHATLHDRSNLPGPSEPAIISFG